MQITRISTQGIWIYMNSKYVTSYVLQYSNDGTNWMEYIDDDNYGKNNVVGSNQILLSVLTLEISVTSIWQ